MLYIYICIEKIKVLLLLYLVVPGCTVFCRCCFFQRVLSVGEDGSYIEGVHWRRVKYIGGGACGRCYFCIDAKTGFLFAIKRVRLSLTVSFYFLP